jgi:hypothetical protein
LSASSTVALGTLNAAAVNVADDSTTNTALIVRNNSATGTSRIYNIAGTIDNRVESQYLTTTEGHIISTSSAHPIRLQANRLNSTVSALTIDTANQSLFGASVGILTDAPSTALDVNGGIACASLDASGAATCSNLTVADRIIAEDILVRSATGFTPIIISDTAGTGVAMLRMTSADVVFQLFENTTTAFIQTNQANRILMRANSSNSSVFGIMIQTDNTVDLGSDTRVAGALTVQGRNVLNDIDGKQATLSSLAGTGETLTNDSSTLRRIFGEGVVTVDIPINNADSTKDFQLRVSGQVLQNQIDILTQRVEALEAAP